MAPSLTRREALGGAAAAAVLASCGGGDPPPSTGPAPGSGAALLGSLLALERAAIAAYGACAELLSGDALRFAEDLKERELRAYLEALAELPSVDLRTETSRICADEANHLGAIRVLRGLPAAQGP